MRKTGRLFRGAWRCLLLGLCLLPLLAPGAFASVVLTGIPALAGNPSPVAGRMVATALGTPLALRLDIVLYGPADHRPIPQYENDLTKRMHVIAVSDDFRIFLHRHVEHVIDGHGVVRLDLPRAGLYHIYVDAVPHGFGHQVLRFDLPAGAARPAAIDPAPTGLTARAGPYTLRFETLDLSAGKAKLLTLHVLKSGKPAADIVPWLGVPAHIVLIGVGSLDYVHVHAMAPGGAGMMAMPGMDAAAAMPGDLLIHAAVPKPGVYKMWVQFQGGRSLYTVHFVFKAT